MVDVRDALNAVRVASDPSPVVLITASADDATLTIYIEAEEPRCDGRDRNRIAGSFGWQEARQLAEGLLAVMLDAEKRIQERARQRREDDEGDAP